MYFKELRKDLEIKIKEELEDIQDNLNIYAELRGIYLFGDMIEQGSADKIEMYINIYPNIEKSADKYKKYGFDYDTDYYDGEVDIIRDINNLIEDKNIHYHGVPVKCIVNMVDFSENKLLPSMEIEDALIKAQEQRISKVKEKLLNSKTKNFLNSDEVKEQFNNLGEAQRNLPEEAMLRAQKILNGGVLSYQIEHVGDLTHRMSDKVCTAYNNPEYALEFISSKINGAYRSLTSGYGFEREFRENLKSNYEFNKERNEEFKNRYKDYTDFEKDCYRVLKEYANEHKKLKVYNKPQYEAKQAAIALGELKFDKALNHIKYLKELIQAPENYIEEISKYNPSYELKLKRKVKIN